MRLAQQSQRLEMFQGCVDAALPDAPADTRRWAAAALQVLYSAPTGELLRVFWDMDAAEAADVVELAVTAMLTGLRTPENLRVGTTPAAPNEEP